MFKYIITWVLTFLVYDPCPSAGQKDEFGRLVNGGWSCAVFHAHTEYKQQSQTFNDRDSAFSFYGRALNSQRKEFMWYGSNGIDSVRIDSVKIKKGLPIEIVPR